MTNPQAGQLTQHTSSTLEAQIQCQGSAWLPAAASGLCPPSRGSNQCPGVSSQAPTPSRALPQGDLPSTCSPAERAPLCNGLAGRGALADPGTRGSVPLARTPRSPVAASHPAPCVSSTLRPGCMHCCCLVLSVSLQSVLFCRALLFFERKEKVKYLFKSQFSQR